MRAGGNVGGRFADFHALRHTAGSLLAGAGVHPKIAQSIMGIQQSTMGNSTIEDASWRFVSFSGTRKRHGKNQKSQQTEIP